MGTGQVWQGCPLPATRAAAGTKQLGSLAVSAGGFGGFWEGCPCPAGALVAWLATSVLRLATAPWPSPVPAVLTRLELCITSWSQQSQLFLRARCLAGRTAQKHLLGLPVMLSTLNVRQVALSHEEHSNARAESPRVLCGKVSRRAGIQTEITSSPDGLGQLRGLLFLAT